VAYAIFVRRVEERKKGDVYNGMDFLNGKGNA